MDSAIAKLVAMAMVVATVAFAAADFFTEPVLDPALASLGAVAIAFALTAKPAKPARDKPTVRAKPNCHACAKPDPAQRCSRCKIVWYCSETCQLSNWPAHKPNCQSFAKSAQQRDELISFGKAVLDQVQDKVTVN
ncbi:hypothetical protein BASA81_003938 [Batrachochytrium salamandrivorans]|nr:hypothetical protein BASA81_003938 [Batrachochytrium salamandrivorans]